MVTGGFRTRRGMEAAVSENGCDFIGVGRPAVLDPTLPDRIVFNPDVSDEDARLYARKIEVPSFVKFLGMKVIGAGAETVSFHLSNITGMEVTNRVQQSWYSKQIPKIGL